MKALPESPPMRSTLSPEIKALHAIDRRRNLVLAFWPLAWTLAVLAMEAWPVWYVRAAGVLVIGIGMQASGILMHEALHGNLFRSPGLDRWVGFLLGVPAHFSASAYKVAHLHHHRFTRTTTDADEIGNLCHNRRQYEWLYRAWFFLGQLLYIFIVPLKALRIGDSSERQRVVAEYLGIFAIYATVTWLALTSGHADWLVWYWILPVGVAAMLVSLRSTAEHLGTGFGEPGSRTRTVTSNSLVSFFLLNLNYHLEHHLYPGVPWYNLPKLHALLAPTYQARPDVAIETSYLRFLLRTFLEGPRESPGDIPAR